MKCITSCASCCEKCESPRKGGTGASFLAVEIGVEVPAKAGGGVVEAEFFVQGVQFLQIGRLELKVAFQIGLDSARRLRLGKHGVAVLDPPCQCRLCAVLAVFLADLDQYGVIHQLSHALAGGVDLVLVAEGGVLLDVDALGFVEGDEVVLLEPRMELDLVCGGDGACGGE